MKAYRTVALLIFSVALTACSPVYQDKVYRSTYGAGQIHPEMYEVYSGYGSHRDTTHYAPIEVTLYAHQNHSYRPIQVVIYDNDYIEVPLKNRKGRIKKVFAHYHRGELHFDRDKRCNRIYGSWGYKQNNKWAKGQQYSQIRLGDDYDLSDYGLKVHTIKNRGPGHAARNNTNKRIKKIKHADNDTDKANKIVVKKRKLESREVKSNLNKDYEKMVIVNYSKKNIREDRNSQIIDQQVVKKTRNGDQKKTEKQVIDSRNRFRERLERIRSREGENENSVATSSKSERNLLRKHIIKQRLVDSSRHDREVRSDKRKAKKQKIVSAASNDKVGLPSENLDINGRKVD